MSNEKPILFKGEMIRAILEGRKTQTRRLAKNIEPDIQFRSGWKATYKSGAVSTDVPAEMLGNACPYGKPGDRLWVRETWQHINSTEQRAADFEDYQKNSEDCFYRADESDPRSRPISGKWRPSIHMPRWASRITLEITDVRVERLQDISEADAEAEGVPGEKEAAAAGLDWYDKPRRAFRFLWQSINGPDSWDANPWVWVIEFKRIDQEAKAA